jgi:hypothetical protein
VAKKKRSLAQRIAADPKLKAKYLSNPGLRSKLPDSALTPDLLKRRQTNTYNKTPITPGSGVTNAQLNRDMQQAQSVRYGQAEQALKQQGVGTMQLARSEQDWYGAYQRELAQHAQNQQAINAQANAANVALQAGIGQVGQAQTAQTQQNSNQSAALSGTQATNFGPEQAQAQAVRAQMAQGLGSLQVATGAANARYADALAGPVVGAQRLSALQRTGQDFQKILGQGQQLAREKGAYGEEYKSGRVADEFKNVLAQQTLGLDTAKAQAQTQAAASQRSETRRAHKASEAVAQGNLGVAKSRVQLAAEKDALQRKNRTGPYAPGGSKSTAAHDRKVQANTKTRSSIQTASSDARYLKTQKIPVRGPDGKPEEKDGKPTGRTRKLTETEIRAALRKRYKDADVANAAMDLAILGHVSPENQRRLKAKGIGVPKEWLPKKARKKSITDVARGGAGVSTLGKLRP